MVTEMMEERVERESVTPRQARSRSYSWFGWLLAVPGITLIVLGYVVLAVSAFLLFDPVQQQDSSSAMMSFMMFSPVALVTGAGLIIVGHIVRWLARAVSGRSSQTSQ